VAGRVAAGLGGRWNAKSKEVSHQKRVRPAAWVTRKGFRSIVSERRGVYKCWRSFLFKKREGYIGKEGKEGSQ